MSLKMSGEVGSVVVILFFIMAYITFSNNYHFQDKEDTTVDKMFRNVQHRNKGKDFQAILDSLNSDDTNNNQLGSGSATKRQQSVLGVENNDQQSSRIALRKPTMKIKSSVEVAPRDVWPPTLSIYLGDASKGPPALLGDPPSNECIHESVGTTAGWEFCLPSLLTISCINCGTTSLGAYLDGHKHLSVGTKKEHKFFVIKCSDDRQGKAYECDWKSYAREFPRLPSGCTWDPISGQASGMKRDFTKAFTSMDCAGQSQSELSTAVAEGDWADSWGLDISPKYFFVEGAAHRIHKMMPNARFLCLLRNPVDRHLSHIDTKFRMSLSGGRRNPKLRDLVTVDLFHSCVDAVAKRWGVDPTGEGLGPEKCSDEYVDKTEAFMTEEKSYSYYIKHFYKWFQLYGRERFLFISDQTLHDGSVRQRLMDEISVFAGVPQYEYPKNSALYDESDELSHASTKKWSIPSSLKRVLWEMFDLDDRNEELYTELGHDFRWQKAE